MNISRPEPERPDQGALFMVPSQIVGKFKPPYVTVDGRNKKRAKVTAPVVPVLPEQSKSEGKEASQTHARRGSFRWWTGGRYGNRAIRKILPTYGPAGSSVSQCTGFTIYLLGKAGAADSHKMKFGLGGHRVQEGEPRRRTGITSNRARHP